jgi:hypothetical protein
LCVAEGLHVVTQIAEQPSAAVSQAPDVVDVGLDEATPCVGEHPVLRALEVVLGGDLSLGRCRPKHVSVTEAVAFREPVAVQVLLVALEAGGEVDRWRQVAHVVE